MIFLLKWIGAVFLLLAGATAGYLESKKLHDRVKRLKNFCIFLDNAATEVSYEGMPVEEICMRHGKSLDFMTPLLAALKAGEPFPQAWKKAEASPVLCEEDRELLSQFGEGFGASDTQGQLNHCSLCGSLTKKTLLKAEEDEKKKGKLYRMLGLFGGAAAALLLC